MLMMMMMMMIMQMTMVLMMMMLKMMMMMVVVVIMMFLCMGDLPPSPPSDFLPTFFLDTIKSTTEKHILMI